MKRNRDITDYVWSYESKIWEPYEEAIRSLYNGAIYPISNIVAHPVTCNV